MKVRFIGCLFAAAIYSATHAASWKPFDPAAGVLLTGDAANALTHQCSRGAPHFDGLWAPDPEQIRDLEARLLTSLASAIGKNSLDGLKSRYARQYAGLIVKDRKIIYVNAFSYEAIGSLEKGDWRSQPVVVCDGGVSFFGVEYDPAMKSFSHFAFNGVA